MHHILKQEYHKYGAGTNKVGVRGSVQRDSANMLLVVKNGKMAQPASVLRSLVPNKKGNYIWTIRPPRSKKWVPVYVGKAGGNEVVGKPKPEGNLRKRFNDYINENTFGPQKEVKKFAVMVDLMSRNFSICIR